MILVPLTLCLNGCADGEPEDELTIAVEAQLRSSEESRSAAVDFDSLVEGDWTRLALICGASDEVISEAFGFDWAQPRESGVRIGFSYAFVSDDHVEQDFGPMTAAPFDDRFYVSSCEQAGRDDRANLILFDRQDAIINFKLLATPAYSLPEAWFPVAGQGTPFYGSRWD